MKLYALRRPDGRYYSKVGRDSWRDGRGKPELVMKCLFAHKGHIRMSWGLYLPDNSALKARVYEISALSTPDPRYNGREAGWYPIWRDALSSLSSEEFFDLLSKDGYQLIELEVNLP